MIDYENIIKKTEKFVKKIMKNYDCSHDFNHVIRVKNNAIKIADNEKVNEETKYKIILCSLLHDVADSKYSNEEDEQQNVIQTFLKNKLPPNIIDEIIYVTKYTSLSKEILNLDKIDNNNIILKCVQDADRIDSLGSNGISRYFAYGFLKKGTNNIKEIIKNIKKRTNILIKFIKTKLGKKIAKKKYNLIKKFINDYNN